MDKRKVIVGLGETGMSCARFFNRRGLPFSVMDRDANPQYLEALRALAPDVVFSTIDVDTLKNAEMIVLSPGVPLALPEIQAAVEAGVPVTGDTAIFAREAAAPIVAITGSNGKSTVTSLVGRMASEQGLRTGVGGNIGTPCLDILDDDSELYVLELSSYQLETASPLPCEVAVVLNLAPDHLDRYPSQEDYYRTKAAIYGAANKAVVNRDLNFNFDIEKTESVITFGLDTPPDKNSFSLIHRNDNHWIARAGDPLINTNDLRIKGVHNHLNAMAALAIGTLLDLDMALMLESLRAYKGLEHRCEPLGEYQGVAYFNDSKSTNIASTEAAVNGLSAEHSKNVILILGGIDKGANFSELVPAVRRHVKEVLVYGRDAANIASSLEQSVATHRCFDLQEVIERAIQDAQQGDIVLFSPACASFDMFDDFEHRGREFKARLQEKLQEQLS